MKYFKPILCIHIAALILGAILLLAIPFEDKLRNSHNKRQWDRTHGIK